MRARDMVIFSPMGIKAGGVDTEAWIEVDGVKRHGRFGDAWIKDLDRAALETLVLRLARELAAEQQAHEETIQLAAGRGCAG